MSISVNIYYSGTNGSARTASGIMPMLPKMPSTAPIARPMTMRRTRLRLLHFLMMFTLASS